MKRKLLMLLVIAALLCLTACHEHSYDTENYQYDETHHWHSASCEHTQEVKDRAEHTLDADGACTVCQYDNSPYVMKLSHDGTYYILEGQKKDISGEITLPETHRGLPVKEINMWAFKSDEYDSTFTKIVIPDSYESIDYQVFSGMASLKTVVIGNGVKQIMSNTFEDCINLESVTFGNSLEAIYAEAFQNCEKLNNVVLPASLKEITYRAFAYCKSLTSIVIPRGVETMLADVFYENDSLTDIYCEIEAQPEGWDPEWCGNYDDTLANQDVKITFGYQG